MANTRKSFFTKEELIELYVKKGLSDNEIAKMHNIDRNTVRYNRNKYNIEALVTKRNLNKDTITQIVSILAALNIQIEKLEENNITLANGRRVKMLTSYQDSNERKTVVFNLRVRKVTGAIENEHRRVLPNGDLKTLFETKCDFIICTWQLLSEVYYWIIPSNIVDETANYTLSLYPNNPSNKYFIYQNNWYIMLLGDVYTKNVLTVVNEKTPFSKRMEIALKLEEREKEMALDRMANGAITVRGQTRDIVAKETGFGSGKQYDRAKYVFKNADQSIIEQIDNNLLTINKAYNYIIQNKITQN